MNKTIFSQTDSRWGKLAYPGSGCTVGGCGCGLVALAHLAIEYPGKEKWDPRKLRPHMVKNGYAVVNQGTRWEGITQTLLWLGYEKVVRVYDADPMSKAWKELNKGDRMGVLLFNNHVAPNGIQWTTSGHYVAFTKYRYKNGKHQFYCKDSGWRNHSGWYSYENSMKGCLPKLWIVKRVTYGLKIGKKANELAYTTNTSKANYPKGSPKDAFKKALKAVFPSHNKWGTAPSKGASCDVFVGTCVRAAGVDKKFSRGLDEQWAHFKKSDKFKSIKPKLSNLKDGDIITYQRNDGGGHICIYYKGKIKEAGYQHYYGKTTNTAEDRVSKSGKRWVKVYRAR